MISYHPQPYHREPLKPIALAFFAACLIFMLGFLLGTADGREEREMLRQVIQTTAPVNVEQKQASPSELAEGDKRKYF